MTLNEAVKELDALSSVVDNKEQLVQFGILNHNYNSYDSVEYTDRAEDECTIVDIYNTVIGLHRKDNDIRHSVESIHNMLASAIGDVAEYHRRKDKYNNLVSSEFFDDITSYEETRRLFKYSAFPYADAVFFAILDKHIDMLLNEFTDDFIAAGGVYSFKGIIVNILESIDNMNTDKYSYRLIDTVRDINQSDCSLETKICFIHQLLQYKRCFTEKDKTELINMFNAYKVLGTFGANS